MKTLWLSLVCLGFVATFAARGSSTPPTSITLCGAAALTAPAKPKKNIGPCQPYAEVCKNCVDCTQCKHCAVIGGKCSVCWKK